MRCLLIAAVATFGLAGCATQVPLPAEPHVYGSASEDQGWPPVAVPDAFADEPPALDAPPTPPPSGDPAPPAEPEPPVQPLEFDAYPEPGPAEIAAQPAPMHRLTRNRCAPCRSQCSRWRSGYVGGGPTVYPGLGFMIEGGLFLGNRLGADIYAEMSMHYQDFTDGFNGINDQNNANIVMWHAGFKMVLRPCCNLRPALRGGIGWAHTSGLDPNRDDVDFGEINTLQNSFGGYVGVGLETDLFKGRITTGPEFRFFAGAGEGGEALIAPIIIWHVLVNL